MDSTVDHKAEVKAAHSRASFALVLSIIAIIILIVLAIIVILVYGKRSILESQGIPLVIQNGSGSGDTFTTDTKNAYIGVSTAPTTVAPIDVAVSATFTGAKMYPITITQSTHNIPGRVIYIRNPLTYYGATSASNVFIKVTGGTGVTLSAPVYVGPQATAILYVDGTVNKFSVLSNTTFPHVPYTA